MVLLLLRRGENGVGVLQGGAPRGVQGGHPLRAVAHGRRRRVRSTGSPAAATTRPPGLIDTAALTAVRVVLGEDGLEPPSGAVVVTGGDRTMVDRLLEDRRLAKLADAAPAAPSRRPRSARRRPAPVRPTRRRGADPGAQRLSVRLPHSVGCRTTATPTRSTGSPNARRARAGQLAARPDRAPRRSARGAADKGRATLTSLVTGMDVAELTTRGARAGCPARCRCAVSPPRPASSSSPRTSPSTRTQPGTTTCSRTRGPSSRSPAGRDP